MCVSGFCHRPLLVVLCLFFSIPLVSAQCQGQRPAAKRKGFVQETYPSYQKWLDEDVRYIITDQERADFRKLTTDDQRDKFVEAFWERRNPTPKSSENPFKEEHYRRIAYANTHFAANVPGYRTDRGRFYIMYGPPDSIESKSALAPPRRPGTTRLSRASDGTSSLRLQTLAVAGNMNSQVGIPIHEFP
jgi:GWxTD domain-containing protein